MLLTRNVNSNTTVQHAEKVLTLTVYHSVIFFLVVSRKSECPAGSYSTGGATACLPCDPGYTCSMGSTNSTPAADICQAGGWCDGKNFFRCPAGTYNQFNGSIASTACVLCPPGRSRVKQAISQKSSLFEMTGLPL